MTLKTRRLHFNKQSFLTPNWRYLETVGNAIQTDQLLGALGLNDSLKRSIC